MSGRGESQNANCAATVTNTNLREIGKGFDDAVLFLHRLHDAMELHLVADAEANCTGQATLADLLAKLDDYLPEIDAALAGFQILVPILSDLVIDYAVQKALAL